MKRFYKAAAVFLIAALSVFCLWGCSGGETGETASPSASVGAEEGTKGLEYQLSSDGESYAVIAYNGWDKDVVIPSSYKGKPVIGIDYAVFANRDILESIHIPGTLEYVWNKCFYGCKNLKSVIIEEGVEFIASDAFYQCYNLESISLPSTINNISASYFLYSTELQYNEYNRIKYLGNEQNKYLFLMNGEHASSVAEIHPQTQFIADEAFANAKNITQISIPGSVKIIGARAFSQCGELTSVQLGDGVESIGVEAFAGCSKLKQIKISKSVSDIGEYAFLECASLSDIQIDNNNQTYRSVTNCIINIPDKSLIYGNQHSVIPNDGSIKRIEAVAFYKSAGLREVVLPDGLQSIGNGAFGGCKDLIKVSIPLSVERVGRGAFNDCELLRYNNHNGDWYLGSDENPFLLLYKARNSYDASYSLHQDTRIIGAEAFQYNRTIQRISIPAGVIAIEDWAFESCCELESLNMPEGLKFIGYRAFYDCDKLADITFPDSLLNIGERAFEGCDILGNITMPGSVKEISEYSFSCCNAMKEFIISEGVECVESWAFEGCSALETVNIPLSIKSIASGAFALCDKLHTFNYSGTKEQWNSIEKADDWDSRLGAYTVQCTDGDIIGGK